MFEHDRIIILDACRYDALANLIPHVEKVKSRGSCTPEWFKNTFTGHYDYVYITANPHIADHPALIRQYGYRASDHFDSNNIIPVWDFGWSDELNTVHPREVVKAYLMRRPKRVILHFVQPHAPYIGSDIKFSNGKDVTRMADLREAAHLGRELLWRAYIRNLVIAMKEVLKLDGEWVITADHGELIGEHGVYGHPCGTKYPELIEVPWAEINLGKRRR